MKHFDERTKLNLEGIAIIGMACRFPGAKNLDQFWHNLQNGVESLSCFSDDELAAAGINPAILNNRNYVKAGAILEDVDQFDADFFGISAAEATLMDPQHRLMLECAWEALEHGGYMPDAVDGAVGVYAGSRISEYMLFSQSAPDLVGRGEGSLITNFQRLVANDKDYLATRISFKLNLTGPSLSVQTACSTSLVAVHLACESLLNGECDLALAGGVSIRVPQRAGYLHSDGMIFSADGHTRAFDAAASGTIFSSGAGMVLLKRLDEAVAAGDNIFAVILGSAINNDGAVGKAGYTAPGQGGQAGVIAQAMEVAGVGPPTVTYVETHGTGTALGDVIEVAALTDVFGARTDAKNFCALGAVKCNIGHTVQAAGVAGLIKTALMLKHKCLVPTPNFERPNPQLNIEDGPFYVNTQLKEWPDGAVPRRAGVSSFGVGGTNAHVVLEEAPLLEPGEVKTERSLHLLTLSARNRTALNALADRYAQHLAATQDSLTDICFTANAGRAHFPKRLAILANSAMEMSQKLIAFVGGLETAGVVSSPDQAIDQPKIAFLFTGQGSQYIDMGRELYDTQPVFRNALDRCTEILADNLDQPLLSVLYPELNRADGRNTSRAVGRAGPRQSLLDQTAITQPALFAVEYGLACLWRSWGVKPDLVVGHSLGEYVAACFAGVFRLEDALRLVAARGRLMQALPADGAMAVILADEARVAASVADYRSTVSIAAINGPDNIVISGLAADVQAISERFCADGIRVQPLSVSHAFHSPLMDPVLADFERAAATIDYSTPTIGLVSNLTGQRLATAPNAAYWRQHVRETVRFSAAMQTLYEQGCNILIEIGPQPTLLGMARRCWPSKSGVWLPSMRQGQPDQAQLFQSLATLYVHCGEIDWTGVQGSSPARRVPLPNYPFQRQRYWVEPLDHQPIRRRVETAVHPLLGVRLASPLEEMQFQSRVSAAEPSFLTEHRVYDTPVFPASAYIAMICAAAEIFFHRAGAIVIEDFVIQQALLLDEKVDTTLQLILRPEGNDAAVVQIFSQSAGEEFSWRRHADGKVRLDPGSQPETISVEALRARCLETVATPDFYRRKRQRGLQHGPQFQNVVQLCRSAENGESLGFIDQPRGLALSRAYSLHPALLDACLQIGEASFSDGDANNDSLYLPMIWERITIFGRLEAPLWSHAIRGSSETGPHRTLDLRVTDQAGRVAFAVSGLHLKRVTPSMLEPLGEGSNWLHHVAWFKADVESADSHPCPIPSADQDPTLGAGWLGRISDLGSSVTSVERCGAAAEVKWLIFADDDGLGSAVSLGLTQQGQKCTMVSVGDFYQASASSYHINPLAAVDFNILLDAVAWSGGGVAYLWGLRDGVAGETAAPNRQSCAGLLHLTQALAARKCTTANRLWIVTRGCQATGAEFGPVAVAQAPLWGMGRVMMREQPELRPTLIDLDPAAGENDAAALLPVLHVEVRDAEQQIVVRENQRYVARLVAGKTKPRRKVLDIPSYPYELDFTGRGILDNLKFRPQKRRRPGPGEVEIQIYATGLNFRDVLNALGQLSSDVGLECSGVIVACGDGVDDFAVGAAVVAVFAFGSFASFVTVDARFVAPKPANLSFEAAAGIPLVFLTAYYCLRRIARISTGDRLLIHAASGGVGMAAIQFAQQAGAMIFATSGQRKKAYLESLGIQHVLSSRSLEFADAVMALTEGQGVDLVLNSLAGDFIPKSLSTVGKNGKFIELGATGTWSSAQVAQLRPDITYNEFHLLAVSRDDVDGFQRVFRRLMGDFERGVLKALPQRVFSIEEIPYAMRLMAQGKHIGKIIISNRDHIPESEQYPTVRVAAQKTYLITGGLGGLGLKIAAWIVAQGARNVALMGRSGASESALKMISEMEAAGAKVVVVQADVTQADQLATALAALAQTMPGLGGIIHAAGVLDDGLMTRQSWARFEAVLRSKTAGAWNLHKLTEAHPLDFFILFSSSAALLGGPGQGAYAAANSYLDGLAHYRRSRGLTAISINWGAWAEVGMAAELGSSLRAQRAGGGHSEIGLEQGLELLKRILQRNETNLAVLPIQWSKYLRQFPVVPRFFSELERRDSLSAQRLQPSIEPDGVLQRLQKAPPPNRRGLLVEYIQGKIARVLGVSETHLAIDRSLLELGVDSLMALELRNQLASDLDLDVPIGRFLEGPTIAEIAEVLMLAREELTDLLTELESLTDEEAQKLATEQRRADSSR